MSTKPGGGAGFDWGGIYLMRITSRWGRASTTAVAAGALASGLVLALGAAPAGAAARVAPHATKATYNCSASVLGTTKSFTGSVTIAATAPAKVAPGGKVSLSAFQATIAVPASFVNEAISLGVTSVSGKISAFTINATLAKVAGLNAAGKGIAIPTTKLVKNQALNIKVPTKPATVGTWTAGTKAGTMDFNTGNAAMTLDTSLADVTVTCTPKPVVTIAHSTVS
jgi:hypothetical protein